MPESLASFIRCGITPYHTTGLIQNELISAGFHVLHEHEPWAIEPGMCGLVVRNGSSLIAFRIPEGEIKGFMITASHCDSPCFKIRPNAEMLSGGYVRLSTEKYGGALHSSWLDRPLSVGGRVMIRTDSGIDSRLISTEPCAVIPNMATHMNPKANEGYKYDLATDMVPLFRMESEGVSFGQMIAALAGADEDRILATDLFLYNPQEPVTYGGLISAPRLDDLQCVYASTQAFIQAKPGSCVQVLCIFDNEEVGSQTRQGAASTFLLDVLMGIMESLGMTQHDLRRLLACSMSLSCDNAHAVHPNHPDRSDPDHRVYLNKGVVIKHNANQHYTTDAVSAGIFRAICDAADIPVQEYTNRPDISGGYTLGNISTTQVSVLTADIGLGQLAMHSAYETAGEHDTGYMIRALTAFYETRISPGTDTDHTDIIM